VAFYALLSLTVVRMVPVALALSGTGLSRPTVLFMGWFGPRGLASIVLGLVYLELEVALPGEPTIRLAITATVLLSILAHGLSALPGIEAYVRRIESLGPGAPEFQTVEETVPKP
jgi:NhaP-type Na+/H+ or K+/H+ antiporter